MTSKIAQAGDVNLTAINMINGGGDIINILPFTKNIDLYESIQSPFMTGSILMSDSIGFFVKFPIIGEEIIELEFETPSTGIKIKKAFFVDNLDMRLSDNSTSAYILHFSSVNRMKDINLKHSKAYEGFGSDIVNTLFKKTIEGNWPVTSGLLHLEKTGNKLKFISNNWSPFQCIDYVARHSVSPNDDLHSPSYLFYEDNKKYNFRTISDIITTNMPNADKKRFYFDAVNGRKASATGTQYALLAEYETILKLTVLGGFKYFERHSAGAWAKRTVEFNVLSKSINTKLYNYWYDFEASGHTGEYPAVSNQVQYDDHNSVVDTVGIFTHKHEGIASDKRGDINAKRVGLLNNLDYMSLEIEIHGRTDLTVGDMINLRLQNFASIVGATQEDDILDPLWSGYYMITQIQHRLSDNRHKMIMRVSKDGVNKLIEFPEKRT